MSAKGGDPVLLCYGLTTVVYLTSYKIRVYKEIILLVKCCSEGVHFLSAMVILQQFSTLLLTK